MPSRELAYLKRLGLSHQEIADALHVEKGTVGNWYTGTRSLSPLFRLEILELLTVLQERLSQGLDVHQVIRDWHPTIFQQHQGVTHTPHLPIEIPSKEYQEALAQGGLSAVHQLMRRIAVDRLTAAIAAPPTAERLMLIRRLAKTIELLAESDQWAMSEEILREGGPHADH
jgi:transcriptional regulator with XRE-family HTH domain